MSSRASDPESRAACGLCCTRLHGLTVRRGGATILDRIDLHIHCGELTALVGPNGAGKTTLLKALLGEIPFTGELHFVGADEREARRPRFGYVPQRLDLDRRAPISVADLFHAALSSRPVIFGRAATATRLAQAALERAGAAALIDRRLGDLSGGELQRVLLALALEPVPEILLLDEPVAGMDAAGAALFYHAVSDLRRRYDLSILLVSHDLALAAEHADQMVVLNRRVVAAAPPVEALAREETIRLCGRIHLSAVAVNRQPACGCGRGEPHS